MRYTNIEDLTVGQYQELYTIHKSDDEDIEKAIASVSILTGKPRWEVEEMEIHSFRQISKEISVLFSNQPIKHKTLKRTRINGKQYAITLDPRKLTAGQYVDLQHFLKGGEEKLIYNLHSLFACIVTPLKLFGVRGKYDGANHATIATGIKSCRFSEVYGTSLFFCTLWNNSISAIEKVMMKRLKKAMKNKTIQGHLSTTDLQKIMDGFTMPSLSQILKT